ncbi:hypothetical protein DTO006G1_741 [Penicillium roqueforti]|nr:hypothetical protein DTO012A8_9663 [Penicillium roqueforti]KAI2764323.1 hypothetical protein DTO006G1_741 [Penicillium roqueforti]KAI3259632.1 hypothetical protein DTO006G7_523 [Penicillium roqueforti]
MRGGLFIFVTMESTLKTHTTGIQTPAKSSRCVVDTTAVNDTTAADGTDTNDDPLPATEYDASSLADDIADESDLGLLREALILPKDGWTTDNPRLRLPRVLRTNITRYAFHTERTFVLALCCLYDESSLQRNGKRPGPLSGGKIDMPTVATWDIRTSRVPLDPLMIV